MPDMLTDPAYLAVAIIVSDVLIALVCIIAKDGIRVGGLMSWVVLLVFAPLGGLLGIMLADKLGVPLRSAVATLAIGFLATIPFIHWVVPGIASDFNVKGLGQSMLLALLVGLGTTTAGYVTERIDKVVPAFKTDLDDIPSE